MDTTHSSPRSFRADEAGLTLVELITAVFIISLVSLGIISAYISQTTLNHHAYNLSRASHDANRVLEQVRRQNNNGCSTPTALVAGGWDAWLQSQTPGKSTLVTDSAQQEILLTCEDEDGGALASDACGPNQVSNSEWRSGAANTTFDPIRVTVAVCWRHNGRIYGECAWNGSSLAASDADGDGIISSPVMLTTLITCRS